MNLVPCPATEAGRLHSCLAHHALLVAAPSLCGLPHAPPVPATSRLSNHRADRTGSTRTPRAHRDILPTTQLDGLSFLSSADVHASLDNAVAVAHDWPADTSDEDVLHELPALDLMNC